LPEKPLDLKNFVQVMLSGGDGQDYLHNPENFKGKIDELVVAGTSPVLD